jgi:hypothetical protein
MTLLFLSLQFAEQLVWVWAVHFLALRSNRIRGEVRFLCFNINILTRGFPSRTS